MAESYNYIPAVDGRLLDTDNRWEDYCAFNKIENPFTGKLKKEEIMVRIKDKDIPGERIEIRKPTEEWKKRRDEYLRLCHTFRLWDLHFWIDNWDKLKWYGNEYVDTSIYMPCDVASRQCDMMCAYFLHECPRAKEELKTPEILGFDGRWEYHDDDD